MRNITCLLLLFSTVLLSAQKTYIDSRDRTHLLGPIERDYLFAEPYDTLFAPSYDAFSCIPGALEALNNRMDNEVRIKIYLGTWCGDSHREVGRFFKILDDSDLDENNIEIIALDNRRDTYKQSPNKSEANENIHRVPTFLFYKDNVEIGRIVEFPKNSLAVDIAQIMDGIPSKPNYEVANEIGNLVSEGSLSWDSLQLQDWEDRLSSEYELNTLGFVLLRRGDIENANKVFQINAELFPKSGYVQTSLAYSYEELGMVESAIDKYLIAYHLDNTSAVPSRRLKEMIVPKEEDLH